MNLINFCSPMKGLARDVIPNHMKANVAFKHSTQACKTEKQAIHDKVYSLPNK